MSLQTIRDQRAEQLLVRLQVALLFAAIGLLVVWPVTDLDTFWHAANGRVMVETGRIVSEEIFSFTAFGTRFHNHEWLSQIILFLVYDGWGTSGLIGFKVLLTLLITAVLFLVARRLGAHPLVAALVTLLTVLAGISRFMERPQLFSFLGIALLTLLLYGWREGRLQSRTLAWLPVIFLLWDTLHGAIYGLIMLGAFVAGESLKAALRDRLPDGPRWRPMPAERLRTLWLWLLVTLGLMLVSPYGLRTYDVFYNLVSGKTDTVVVGEFLPTAFQGFELFWVLLAVTVVVLLLDCRRLDPTHLLILLPFVFLAVRYARCIAPFGLVALPFLSAHASALFERYAGGRARRGFILGLAVLASLGYVGYFKFVKPDNTFAFGLGIREDFLPVGATRFIKETNLSGNMYNNEMFGGFFAFFLGPERKIFHYNHPSVFKDYLRYVNDPRMPDTMNINYAIINTEHELRLFPAGRWAPVYWGRNETILLRRSEQNRDLIERYETRFFRPMLPDQRIRLLAANPVVFPALVREMSDYLAFNSDRRIAERLGEFLARPGVSLPEPVRRALLQQAARFNSDSPSLAAALASAGEGLGRPAPLPPE